MSEPQKNELAKGAFGLLDKYGEKLWNGVKHTYKEASKEARVNWHIGYERYLTKVRDKYGYAKSFLNTSDPVPLHDFYVPLGVSCFGHVLEAPNLTELSQTNRFAIITALGGSGKSMLMRHFLLDALQNTYWVPVFVELRDLSNSSLSLLELVEKKLVDNQFDFGHDYIELAMKAGHFVFLFDGFDEVADERREQLIAEIDDLATKFDQNCVIISSRPDNSLRRWELFQEWKVNPLSLELAVELVEKSNAEDDIREQFISDLQESLFEKHVTFLANPLLLSIMLITYENTGSIPHKLSTFYDRAYTALFEQHDARKAFHRVKRTKLDVVEFRRLFAGFCFLSYLRNRISFSKIQVLEAITSAEQLTGVSCDREDFLRDLESAVCLIVSDGMDFTYTHRSFQEYFASVFNSGLHQQALQEKFFLHQANQISSNESLELSYQIDNESLEKGFIIPQLERLADASGYEGTLTTEVHGRLLEILYRRIDVIDDEEYGPFIGLVQRKSPYHALLALVRRHYSKWTPRAAEDDPELIDYARNLQYDTEISIAAALADAKLGEYLRGEIYCGLSSFEGVFNLPQELREKHTKVSDLLSSIIDQIDGAR